MGTLKSLHRLKDAYVARCVDFTLQCRMTEMMQEQSEAPVFIVSL